MTVSKISSNKPAASTPIVLSTAFTPPAISSINAKVSHTPAKPNPTPQVYKNNRVEVFERSTGRCLTGNSAPVAENLKRWLQEHPTFEVVSPGSAQALAIKNKKQQLQQLSKIMAQGEQKQQLAAAQLPKKIQTTLKIGPSKSIQIINPQNQSAVQTTSQKTPDKEIVKIQKTPQQVAAPSLSGGTSKQSPVAGSKTVVATANVPKASPIPLNKRKPDNKPVSTPTGRSDIKPEPIRINVQRTLREQLKLRMDEQTDATFPKMTDDEIETFAKDTEREIFVLFSKDTGVKYRAKYRSLMFNIKDRKNTSLFLKICDRSITTQQLVRMNADELASQELAQWRENENKHQLEMIKKSELDMLACAKSYVLKTHKGEEVIESSSSDRVSLDPTVSVEDVVSVLNNSTVSSTSEGLEKHDSPAKDTRIDNRFERYHSGGDHLNTGSTSKTPPAVVKSSGSTSASKRSRSASKEGGHSDSKKTSSSSSSSSAKHSKHSRERSKDRPRSDHHSSSDKKDDRSKDKHKSSVKTSSLSDKDKEKRRDDIKKSTSESKVVKDSQKPSKTVVENYSIIDKILEAQSTIDRILRPDESSKKEPATDKTAVAVKSSSEEIKPNLPKSTDVDTEPTSTVTIPTPPESLRQQNDSPMDVDDDSNNGSIIWSGSIFMVDVATFQISVSPVIGDCSGVAAEMPDELDVVGRISPDTVWEYISKIKKSINKEILVVRFSSATQDNKEAYYTLYKYLSSRKRFGVIKTKSMLIKDFYIFPLAAHKSMPSIFTNVGKDFDQDRKDLLLGVIVFNVVTTAPPPKKRPSAAPAETVSAKVSIVQVSCSRKSSRSCIFTGATNVGNDTEIDCCFGS